MTPFVAESTEKTRQTPAGYENYPKKLTGEDYLKAWKAAGGEDIVEIDDARPYSNMTQPFEEGPKAKA